jgi:serine/threonine protein kinase
VVLGAVITDGVIVQRLTNSVWVGLDCVLNESHIADVAKVFWALKTSLGKLRLYYESVNPSPTGDPAPSRYFPSITSYHHGKELVEFDYNGFLELGPDCVTFCARTKAGQDIVVKFVDRYGERAHRLLADADLAPELLYYGTPHVKDDQPSYQSISMVVMKFVAGDTLAEAMQTMNEEMIEMVRSEVQRALELLHSNGLVFGDLRPPNVMIDKNGKVKLIDFNWPGEEGQAKYPSLMSQGIAWPEGVKALAVMKREHDLDMLDKLFKGRLKGFKVLNRESR